MSGHSLTVEFEVDGCWPTLRFSCHEPETADCRTVCQNSECDEGCYAMGEPGHERKPAGYCNNLEWFHDDSDVAGAIFGGTATSITAPILVSWERGEDGPLWRFATESGTA